MNISDFKGRSCNAKELAAIAAKLRLEMFDVLHERQTGHWGGSSSAAEIVTALYFNLLKIDPSNPKKDDRDRFVLSKGHASINLYTILANRGFFDTKLLSGFRTLGSILQGHPSMKLVSGVDMSTGALGHGLSVACGMALASTLSGKNFRSYILSGEGCLNEGSTWEAMLYAAKMKPKGLIYMIDYNKVQLDGTNAEILPIEPLADKFKSFGWHLSSKKYNGHDTCEILESFKWIDSDDVWPKAIIYDTVKGKGVDFMEGKNAWHGAPIDKDSYDKGRPQLVKDAEEKEASL
ncbi:MAG: transketolase [Termitinemataceae bacterium]|nr:MAG: transketolase [Termitinemataceae bacterium]